MRIDPDFSRGLIDMAVAAGADMAEVYERRSTSLTVEVKGGAVEALEKSISYGYCLRIIRSGKLGFSYATDKNGADDVVRSALESAEFTGEDAFLDMPRPAQYETPSVFDPGIARIGDDGAIGCAMNIERACLAADKRITKIRKSAASFSSSEKLIANSKGIMVVYPSTYASAQITAIAEEGGDEQMGSDFDLGRFISDVDFARVGRSAAERALMLIGARKISASRVPVLMDNSVASEFLSIFSSMLSSESVQKGKSLLKGKLGQRVINDRIDIVDNGLLERGPGSRLVDDEGVPAQYTELIKAGVLKGYMYNTHTAKKDGVHSTGNAVRGGIYSTPGVGPSNLYIKTADTAHSPDEMILMMRDGLYIMEAMGVHTADRISGDFSVGVSGLWIENGKAAYPVKEAVISGNILSLFDNVSAGGNDMRFFGNIGSPSILFGPTDVSA